MTPIFCRPGKFASDVATEQDVGGSRCLTICARWSYSMLRRCKLDIGLLFILRRGLPAQLRQKVASHITRAVLLNLPLFQLLLQEEVGDDVDALPEVEDELLNALVEKLQPAEIAPGVLMDWWPQ